MSRMTAGSLCLAGSLSLLAIVAHADAARDVVPNGGFEAGKGAP